MFIIYIPSMFDSNINTKIYFSQMTLDRDGSFFIIIQAHILSHFFKCLTLSVCACTINHTFS